MHTKLLILKYCDSNNNNNNKKFIIILTYTYQSYQAYTYIHISM